MENVKAVLNGNANGDVLVSSWRKYTCEENISDYFVLAVGSCSSISFPSHQ
jgi:hypothetical protein